MLCCAAGEKIGVDEGKLKEMYTDKSAADILSGAVPVPHEFESVREKGRGRATAGHGWWGWGCRC